MKTKKHIPFYLIVFSIFIGLISPYFFAKGMFLDGVSYATISNNLANNLGSFWSPHYTSTLFPSFYEHPPLAFGLQSVWYRLFGDSFLIEKFYSLITFIIVGIVITKIWKQITNDQKTAWIPLLFWVLIPDVSWATCNNILENTMSIFASFSVLFFLKSNNKKQFIFIVISGLFLFLAFLTKGFTGLYVFSGPFFYWAFISKKSKEVLKNPLKKMIVNSLLIVTFTITPLLILFLIVPNSYFNIHEYVSSQVIESIQNRATVGNRVQIFIDFISNLLPALILGLALFFIRIYSKAEKKPTFNYKNYSYFFFAIALAGVIPIMISLKQRGFYIITVYPFFSIGLGLVFYAQIKNYIKNISVNKIGFKVGFSSSIIALIFSLFLLFSNFNKKDRDQELINISYLIKNKIGGEKTISICHELSENWITYAYFMRNSSISLSSDENNLYKYYLTTKRFKNKVNTKLYKQVILDSKTYFLFEKK